MSSERDQLPGCTIIGVTLPNSVVIGFLLTLGNVFKERTDGGTPDFMTMQIGAALAIAEVDAELGEDNARNMKLFCHQNYQVVVRKSPSCVLLPI